MRVHPSLAGTPLSHVGIPVSHVGTPLSHVGTPLSQAGTPLSLVCTPLSHVGTPVSHVGTPLSYVGTPLSHAVSSMLFGCISGLLHTAMHNRHSFKITGLQTMLQSLGICIHCLPQFAQLCTSVYIRPKKIHSNCSMAEFFPHNCCWSE